MMSAMLSPLARIPLAQFHDDVTTSSPSRPCSTVSSQPAQVDGELVSDLQQPAPPATGVTTTSVVGILGSAITEPSCHPRASVTAGSCPPPDPAVASPAHTQRVGPCDDLCRRVRPVQPARAQPFR